MAKKKRSRFKPGKELKSRALRVSGKSKGARRMSMVPKKKKPP